MTPQCPHCGGKIATAPVLWSATGLSRYFQCHGCMRPLSVRSGWKVGCICMAFAALVTCGAINARQHGLLPYLVLPVVLGAMAIVVRRFAGIRIVPSASSVIPLCSLAVLLVALYTAACVSSL